MQQGTLQIPGFEQVLFTGKVFPQNFNIFQKQERDFKQCCNVGTRVQFGVPNTRTGCYFSVPGTRNAGTLMGTFVLLCIKKLL